MPHTHSDHLCCTIWTAIFFVAGGVVFGLLSHFFLPTSSAIYRGDTIAPLVVKTVSGCAAGILLFSIFYVSRKTYKGSWRSRRGLYVLILIWSVGPPIWFWLEYFYLFSKFAVNSREGLVSNAELVSQDPFELLKYGQQLAAAIWAGMLAFLAGTVLGVAKPGNPASALFESTNAAKEQTLNILKEGNVRSPKDLAEKAGIPINIAHTFIEQLQRDGCWTHKDTQRQ